MSKLTQAIEDNRKRAQQQTQPKSKSDAGGSVLRQAIDQARQGETVRPTAGSIMLPTAGQGPVTLPRANESGEGGKSVPSASPMPTVRAPAFVPASAASRVPALGARNMEVVQTDIDGVNRALQGLKEKRDTLNGQARSLDNRVSAWGRLGYSDPNGLDAQQAEQLRLQAGELDEPIAQLERNRTGLQEEWNRADQRQFEALRQTADFQTTVAKAMGTPIGQSVDSQKPSYRDVRNAMTYIQLKDSEDERFSAATSGSTGTILDRMDKEQRERMAATVLEQTDMALDRMDRSQRERLAYYVGLGDYDGAVDYLNRIAPELNRQAAAQFEQGMAEWSQAHPIQGAAVNTVSWPLNIPAYVANAKQAAKNLVTGKNEQDPHLTAYAGAKIGTGTSKGVSEAARNAATQTFGSETAGDVAAFLASTGLSMGQNATQIAILGPYSLAGMSISAAGSATADALDRGATPQQAFIIGTAGGTIEAVTEKIPLENLFRLAKEGGGTGMKAAVKELLKQMGTEAGEEMISEIANNIVDTAVMGDSSEFQMYVKELQEAGLSKEEAERQAFQQFYLINVGLAGLGGAISGGVMSGGAMMFHQAGQYAQQLNADTKDGQRVNAAIDRAYQAMAEKGMFSQEAGQAIAQANQEMGKSNPILSTGERALDVRDGIVLPRTREDIEFLPRNQGILLPVEDAPVEGQRPAESSLQTEGSPHRASEGDAESQTVVTNGREVVPNSDTAAGQEQTDVKTKTLLEQIQETKRGLREGLRQGMLTEKEFDAAMDAVMERESLAGLSMLDGPDPAAMRANSTEGGAENGTGEFERTATPEEQQLSGGGAQRAADQGAGGQAGVLEEGGSQRAADPGRAAIDRQNAARNLRLETVSSRELGVANGTDVRSVRLLPEEAWDGELRNIARKARREAGCPVRFTLGSIEVTGNDGAVHRVRGVYGQDGIIVQADHLRVSAAQIADHEIFHSYAQQNPGLIQAVEDAIADRYGPEELYDILAAYAKDLRGIVDVPESGTDLEFEQAFADIKEEVFADAFAGINAFGTHAEQYQDTVLETLESRGVAESGSQENAQAVDRRTGPPEAYSIDYDQDNRPFVTVEEDILDGVPRENWVKTVKDNLRKKFPNGVTVGSNEIKINNQSRREMTFSQYMQRALKTEPQLYADKLRATNNADEILRASQNWVNEALLHPRKDAIIDFARGEVQLRVGGNDYTAQVVVGNRGNGNLLMYDIINLTPTVIHDRTVKTGADNTTKPHEGTGSRRSAPVFQNSIPQQGQNVKNQSSGFFFPTAEQGTVTLPGNVSDSDTTGRERFSVDEDVDLKRRQFNLIQESNPAEDDYHTWIRNADEIKRFQETLEDSDWADYDEFDPSYSMEDARRAVETGSIVVYSSHPIEIGTFVSPSRMEAESYAGDRQIYSREVRLTDVAWIDPTQGQFAPAGSVEPAGTLTLPRGTDFGSARFSMDEDDVSNLDTPMDGIPLNRGEVLDGSMLPTLEEVMERRAQESAGDVSDSDTAGKEQTETGAQQENAENVPNSGTSVIDGLPAKARDYLQKAERKLLNKIGDLLSVPKAARREFLQDIVRGISTEYLSTGQVSQETRSQLFEQAYEQGVETDREYYDTYKHVRDYLRKTPIEVSEWLKGDIDDYNEWRKGAFGTLRLVKKGGIGPDTAYMELQHMAPGLFPDNITHPADQLRHILETAKGIRVSEQSLNETYGPDAEEFKRWSRRDFDETIADALGELRQVKWYADERTAAKQVPQTPNTTQEVAELWGKVKGAKRVYERAAGRNLLTQHDEIQVGRLLRGELELEHLDPAKENVKGITEVYEAAREYEELARLIRAWNNQRKAALREQADGFLENANEWKDKKAGILYSRETMERNIRDIVPDAELADRINRAYFQPVHQAAAKANQAKNTYRDRVRDLKLSRKAAKGDLVSEAHAVQLLGEAEDNIRILQQGRMEKRDGKTLQDWQAVVGKLWEENPSLNQGKIRNAVQEFRTIYDELFQQMNETRVRNGYEPVNYRQGYFPHFQPGSEGILALFGRALGIDTAADSLPTTINGLTHTFKPGIQWFGNAQERLGFNTVYDAVEGFDRYIEGVADVIYQTDNIQALRALGAQARYRTGDEGLRQQVDAVRARTDISEEEKQSLIDDIHEKGKFALNNFVVELDEYTNLLANKKSRSDRDMEQAAGRRMYNIMKKLEGRVAANMVAVNPASWLTNFVPLTQGWAALDYGMLLKGMWGTLKAYRADDGIVGMSSFLTNRRGSDPIVKTWSQSASAALSSPMEYIDQFTSDSLVRARFQQNLKHGMSETAAMEEADAWAAGVMADRSKGATPTLFNRSNPMTKLFTQFQLEVNNQLSYLFKDLPSDLKKKGLAALCAGLLKFFMGAFLYNEVYEYFIGRRCALDPIGILNDTAGDFTGYELPNLVELGVGMATGDRPSFETEKKSANEALGLNGLAGNIAEELPFVGGVLGGGRLPAFNAVETLGGLYDVATRDDWSAEKRLYETGKAISGPATYLALPFGGGQIKKIFQGLKAVSEGGSYTVDNEGNDILQYPVFNETAGETAANYAGALLFGKSTLPTAREWADSGFSSLNAKQTACYQGMTELGVPGRDAFELIQAIRAVKAPTGDDVPAEEKAAAQKRRLIQEANISAEGKSVAYYGLLASDRERELMDELSNGGTDMGETARVLMELKDANMLKTGKSAAQKETIMESSLDEEEKDAVFRYVLPDDSKGAAWSEKLRAAGLDQHTAAATANALNSLTPEEGKKTVSDGQKWRAVLDAASGEVDQKAALLTVMSDSARMRYEIADSFGIKPETWVQVKEALPQFDANGNGSYSGEEIENAIDALGGNGALLAPWDKDPLRLSREEKAVLWQLYTGSKSGSGNPYSTRVGKQAAKELEKAREEAKEKG